MNTDKNNFKELSVEQILEERQRLIQSLPPIDRLLRGSLISRFVKCGKPNCRCATGQGHPSLYLSTLYEGKTRMDYVPAAWEPWVKERLENYHLTERILLQLTEINLELLRRRKND